MPPPRLPPPTLLLLLLLAIAPPSAPQPAPGSPPQEGDLRCLRGIKRALSDPTGRLADWDFRNTSAGAVCAYTGVGCWNTQESPVRVHSLSLPGLGLAGPIPASLQYCRAATALDLSGNALAGGIPPALCDRLPYLVTLDLSSNRLTGPVPAALASCRFLHTLRLSGNQLEGQIPAELARLGRLQTLDLSGNRLQGQIPPQLGERFSEDSFSGNSGLCGRPVSSRCGKGLEFVHRVIFAAKTMVTAPFASRWLLG